jgi:uncharacterized protein (TIGR03435 family)
MKSEDEFPMSGGYIYLAASACPTMKIPVESADMASAMLQRYRDQNRIEEQAGLRIQQKRCAVAVLVIDRINAKPSEN